MAMSWTFWWEVIYYVKAKNASNIVTFHRHKLYIDSYKKTTYSNICDNVFSTSLFHSAWWIAYRGALYHTSPINSSPLKRYWKTSHFKLYWFILARVIILKLFFFQKSNSLFPMKAQWISPREMTRLTSKHDVNANFLIKLVN